jgi:hypothetical protein
MKVSVFWIVKSYALVCRRRGFTGTCFSVRALSIYQTARSHILEYYNFHCRRLYTPKCLVGKWSMRMGSEEICLRTASNSDFRYTGVEYSCTRTTIIDCRSHWPRCLSHEMSSPAQTLGSWFRIPLKARMSVCVRQRPCDGLISHPRSPTYCLRLRNWSGTRCFMNALYFKWEQKEYKKKNTDSLLF